ncbi:MAG: SIR2 family protein [Flavobacterium sp.]|nr:SIR2 family protein [Flavobacterium sp.]
MKKFSDSEVIILLGAGASCDAGILNSAQMINEIERKLDDVVWDKYKRLYRYIKSVHFQKQIVGGQNPNSIGFNIEDLVSLLDIIVGISKTEIDTYTFVGSWEKDLQPFITEERSTSLVSDFKESIVKELRGEWLMPTDWKSKSSYYKKFIDLKNELDGFPLKIFSLNYDLCVEQNLKDEKTESGFDEFDNWNFRRYDYGDTNKETSFYFYKLHGSINWQKTKEERLIKTEGDIKTDDLAIIFGISNKLQSYDPYLFYFYEFREHCLGANLIISSGYSFLDDHINDVIKQGLKDSPEKRLLVNVYNDRRESDTIKNEISEILKIPEAQIEIYNKKAIDFFNKDLNVEEFAKFFLESDSLSSLPENF